MSNSASIAVRPRLELILASLLRADAISLVKNRRGFALSLLLPLIMLIVLSRGKAEQRFGGVLFVIGLSIVYGLVSTSILGYALMVARDREQGVFQRLRVTPAPTWAIMVSRLAVQVVANLIIAVLVLVVGSAINHLSLSAGQYALLLAFSILGGAVFLSIGQALVGLLKSADTVNAAGRIVFIVLIFLGLFALSGILGSALESIGRWSPVGVLMTLFSTAQNVGAWDTRDTLSVVACAGYIVVCAGIGIRWFQWDAR